MMRALLPKWSISFVLVLPALLLSGCALSGGSSSTTTATSLLPTTTGVASLKGEMRGGQQAIYNATITLYEMNTATPSYGAAPIQVAQTTTATDGSFSFAKGADGGVSSVTGNTYACPATASGAAAAGTVGTAVDPEMYLMGSGGDTSGTINSGNESSAYNNASAKFVLAIGDCESLTSTTPVVMNEMTTVGTMVALQQYFNPLTENIGAPSTNVTGLVNAVGMISNLVSIPTGAAQQNVTPTSPVAGITLAVTPEYQKLDTMANILAACVSSNPTGKTNPNPVPCGTLQQAALPPGDQTVTNVPNDSGYVSATFAYPAATDTLLAVYYMSTNPTDSQNVQGTYEGTNEGALDALYALPSQGTSPFGPVLSAEPGDWTVGANFTISGTCTNTLSTGTAAGSAPVSQPLLYDEYGLAVDKSGNLWMGGSGGSTTTGIGITLSEFTPAGVPISCISASSSGNTAGRRIAIDSQGNIWWATTQGMIEDIQDPTNAAGVNTLLTWPQPAGIKASGVVADQYGNIYVSPDATAGYVYEYPGVATATSAFAASSIVALGGTGTLEMSATGAPYRDVTINKAGNLVTVGSVTSAYVYTFTGNGASPEVYTVTKPKITSGESTGYGMGLALDGTSVGGNTCCARAGGLYDMNPNTATMVNYSGNFAGGQNIDRAVEVDGANNIWTSGATYANDPTGTLLSIGETTGPPNYTAISPAGNETITCASTAGACEVDGGYSKPFFYDTDSVYGMALDSSGNVWAMPDSSTTSTYWVIVGAAVPVVTPMVANIH